MDVEDVSARYCVFDLDGTLITLPVEWDKVRSDLQKLTGTSLDFNPFFLDIQTIIAKNPGLLGPILKVIDDYEAMAVPEARLDAGGCSVQKDTRAARHRAVLHLDFHSGGLDGQDRPAPDGS
jgi:hypothetical protein